MAHEPMAQDERNKFLEWSKSIGINRSSAEKLLKHLPPDGVLDPELPCWICSPSYTMAANEPTRGLGVEEQLRREGFLVIGSCPNGDPVLIGFRDAELPVYYLSHEELHRKPLLQIIRKVSDSIATYDEALSDEKSGIPLDYWD